MAGSIALRQISVVAAQPRATAEPAFIRRLLIGLALAFLGIFLCVPLAAVFVQALQKGVLVYLQALREPDAFSAIRLTLLTAAIAVPLNLTFGVAAAWAIAKFEFIGKSFLITLIDVPFAVSPVISGLIFVLLLVCKAGLVLGCMSTTSRSSLPCQVSSWQPSS